ncbi:MAG: hypothetical protein LAO76_21875 [Acidobacteriia bacterium]|nr:hypothetical protein [Terriglobia bacterium]
MEDQQGGGTPGAQEIFGLPQGSRTVLQRTMSDYHFQVVASKRPEVAAALESINGQTAMLITANDDLVELRLDHSITLGSAGEYENVGVLLERRADQLFNFSVSGSAKAEGMPPLAYSVSGLGVEREGSRFVLTSGEPRLRFAPSTGRVEVEVFTAPFLVGVPAILRAFAPQLVGLVSVTVQE